MSSGAKFRSLIRGTEALKKDDKKEDYGGLKNSVSTDLYSAPQGIVLKDLLKLEKAPQEEVKPHDPLASISSRIDFRLRHNMQQYQLFQTKKPLKSDRYKQTADSVVLASDENSRARSLERTNLPSIDSTPARAIRTFIRQAALSTSVDHSSSQRTAGLALGRSIQASFSKETSERQCTSEDILPAPTPTFKQLKPASKKLPSLFKEENKPTRMPLKTYERVLGRTDKREAQELRDRSRKLAKADSIIAGMHAVSKGVLLSAIDYVQPGQENPLAVLKDLQNHPNSGQNSASKLVKPKKTAQLPIAQLSSDAKEDLNKQAELQLTGLLGSGAIQSIFEKNAITEQEMLDEQELIYYIKMLFNDESDSSQFVYALNTRTEMPYNLRPVSHQTALEHNEGFYYTISKEKVVKYDRRHVVVEFNQMDEWLREKLRFNQLKTLELVRKFRKIKALKAWVRQIRQFKKNYAAKMVELKLPLLDPLLCKPILDFKSKCLEIEELNYFILASDRQFSLSQLKVRQERSTELFKHQLETRDTKMKEIVKEVIVAFNQQLKDCAFQEMTEDLRAGLAAIKMPDPNIYTDSIELEGEMLAFFHKLMTLNIPYRVKSKIRNLCHKVLSLPTIFDNLRLSSLLNCYGYNIERLSDFIQDSKDRNTDEPVVWIDPKPKGPPKKLHAYMVINFSINEKYQPDESKQDLEIETEQIIRTGSETNVDPRNFDFASNWQTRGFSLTDITDYDVSRLHEYTNYQDLSDMMGKAYMFDRTYPEQHQVRKFTRPEETLVMTEPDFDTLKNFLIEQYNALMDGLSTYERTSASGNFNMFYKLLFYWENEDYRPDFKSDTIQLRDIVGEIEFKQFYKAVVQEIEADYRAVYTISKQLAQIATQHWRNCQVDPFAVGNDIPRFMGFMFQHLFQSFACVADKDVALLAAQVPVGSLLFSIDNFSKLIQQSSEEKQRAIITASSELVKRTVEMFREWIRSNNEVNSRLIQLFNEPISTLHEFTQMKYRSIKIARCLINVRVILNEFDDYFSVVKNSTYGQKLKTEIITKITEANQACENLINLVCSVESGMTKIEDSFELLLRDKAIKTTDFLEKLYQQIIEPEIMSLDISHIQALDKMSAFQESYQLKADKLRNLGRASTFLRFQENIDMSLIGQIEYALKYRRILWELNRDLVELVDRIRYVEVVRLKIDEIDQFVGLKEQVLKSLLKNLPESPCLTSIAELMKKLSQLSPFMKALVSPYLKENHKEELRKIYQRVCSGETIALMSSGQVTLAALERLQTDKIRSEVISMSLRAYHEDFLTSKLKELKEKWNHAEVPMDPIEKRTELMGLGNLKKYHEDFADTMQTISKILSNKHVNIIQREAEEFEKNLRRANTIIVRTENLQQRLVFFEDLFGAPDIKKHMVAESLLFDNSSKLLLGVLKRIENRTAVMGIWRVSQIEDHLGKVVANFDALQGQVETHLSAKRQRFSRLYLLNDEELLDLMAQFYKNVNVFNTYLGKMFQAVHSIKLVEENSDHYINGIVSPNGEMVQFAEIPFQSKGALEEVMEQLLLVMRTKIKDLIFKRVEELMETMINTRLEKFELEKFAKDNVLQPALIAMDYFLDQLIMSTVGKDEDQAMENILVSCLYSTFSFMYRSRETRNCSYD